MSVTDCFPDIPKHFFLKPLINGVIWAKLYLSHGFLFKILWETAPMPWSVVPLIWGRLILTLSYRLLSISPAPKSTYLLDTPDFKFTMKDNAFRWFSILRVFCGILKNSAWKTPAQDFHPSAYTLLTPNPLFFFPRILFFSVHFDFNFTLAHLQLEGSNDSSGPASHFLIPPAGDPASVLWLTQLPLPQDSRAASVPWPVTKRKSGEDTLPYISFLTGRQNLLQFLTLILHMKKSKNNMKGIKV